MNQKSALPHVFVETYGCQMNVLDTELVRGQLEALGYTFVSDVAHAGVVLLNTCSVRALSEQKVWSQLGRLGIDKKRREDGLLIGVLGCMAEREGPSILRRMPHVDLVCGPSSLDQLPQLIDNAARTRAPQMALAGHTARRTKTRDLALSAPFSLDLSRAFDAHDAEDLAADGRPFRAFVRITRGCNKFCAFCVVPYTRGPETHRPPDDIVEEVKKLVGNGVAEVTLLGQTINHYAYSDGGRTTSFADLLRRIHEEVVDLVRLRFLTSYPRDFSDDALDVMAASPRICRYLHIPAQSGSDVMLKKMNRGYDVETYLGLIERARARMPDIRLTGDMIVGYSGETEADHRLSLELLKKTRYKGCYIFKYSPRSGTVSARRHADDVPDGVKKERNLEMLNLQHQISREHYAGYIGTTLNILVEGRSHLKQAPKLVDQQTSSLVQLRPRHNVDTGATRLVGRTEGDEIAAFDGSPHLIGKLVKLEIFGTTALTLSGRLQIAGIDQGGERAQQVGVG